MHRELFFFLDFLWAQELIKWIFSFEKSILFILVTFWYRQLSYSASVLDLAVLVVIAGRILPVLYRWGHFMKRFVASETCTLDKSDYKVSCLWLSCFPVVPGEVRTLWALKKHAVQLFVRHVDDLAVAREVLDRFQLLYSALGNFFDIIALHLWVGLSNSSCDAFAKFFFW